jgi:hypothetical protein
MISFSLWVDKGGVTGVGGTSSNADEKMPSNEEEECARFKLARDNKLWECLSLRLGLSTGLERVSSEDFLETKLGGYEGLG